MFDQKLRETLVEANNFSFSGPGVRRERRPASWQLAGCPQDAREDFRVRDHAAVEHLPGQQLPGRQGQQGAAQSDAEDGKQDPD